MITMGDITGVRRRIIELIHRTEDLKLQSKLSAALYSIDEAYEVYRELYKRNVKQPEVK